METKYILGFLAVMVIIVGGVAFFAGNGPSANTSPYNMEALAQCLKDKGATFYGAFWCPHCQATKKMFGAASSKLPYTECSTPDGRGQLQVCIDKGITNYPTWIFADGTTLTGELTALQLAEASSCELLSTDGTPVPVTPSLDATSTPPTASSTSPSASTSPVR